MGDAFDPTKKELFYCPLGGRIEFGESSEVALRREIMEELGVEIENPQLLGVLENLFTFDGRRGHEIVFVYDAKLKDPSLYTWDRFKGHESNGQSFNAIWLDLPSINSNTPPVYPDVPFSKRRTVWPDHHLYVCPHGSIELARHLLFRDKLRSSEALRQEHLELKQEALRRAGGVRQVYVDEKARLGEAFFRKVLDA